MNFEKPESPEKEKQYKYDAIIVLGGGLSKTEHKGKFYPTDYRHGDPFGMLGGGMRVLAAAEMYLSGEAENFVFSTGRTEKNKAQFGENLPTEAEIYGKKFLDVVNHFSKKKRAENLEAPQIIHEDRSFNTLSNIVEILQIIKDKGWKKVAIISSAYHIPRVEALYNQALEKHPELQIEINFVSAEDTVEEAEPGKYEKVIKQFYNTPEAKKRIKNEKSGIEDIKSGKYAVGEFQLKDKK
jgi:uncharacterized SAM-binding protein YcdF (DUF218 family)